MKKVFTLFAIIFSLTHPAFAQTWNTWEGGHESFYYPAGTYGTQGIGNVENIPGPRHTSISWTVGDTFWLFGGLGFDGIATSGALNDLWKFNKNNGQWTWVSGNNARNQKGVYGTKGIGSTSNVPGARFGSVSWVEDDTLWLFGGFGYDSTHQPGHLNDLWKYNITNGQWTWVSGSPLKDQSTSYGTKGVSHSSNSPGGRYYGVSWAQDNVLWLMGGNGYTTYPTIDQLNDLWKFDIASNEWTWVSGDNSINQNGVYGTLGNGSVSNTPGSRIYATAWLSGDSLWLMGGIGYSEFSFGYLNDLWRFNTVDGQWTWVGGSKNPNEGGTYGTQNVGSTSNVPGGRYGGLGITINDSMYLIGGYGYDENISSNFLNDVWKYNPANGHWTWLSGSKFNGQEGEYGILGYGSLDNHPGARFKSVGWAGNDTLWLFGGDGYDETGHQEYLYDLWSLDLTCDNAFVSRENVNATVCKTGSAQFDLFAEGWITGYQWQRDTGTGWHNLGGETNDTLNLGSIDSMSDGYLYRCIVVGYCGNDTSTLSTLTVNYPIVGSVAHDTVCSGSDGLISAYGNNGSTIFWYENSSGGEILRSGNQFVVSSPTSDTTFYTDAATMNVTDTLNAWQIPDSSLYGMVFSLVSQKEILTLNALEVGFKNAGSADVSIYYRTGGFSGFEGSTSGWTLLDTFVNKPCVAFSSGKTLLTLHQSFSLSGTQQYSFMILVTNGNSIGYKNAGTTNTIYQNNEDLHFYTGMALTQPLGGITYTNKSLSAVFHYQSSACVNGTRTPVNVKSVSNPVISGITSSLNPNYNSIYVPLKCSNLTATASGGNGTLSYSWSPGGSGNPLNICPTTGTWYTVTVTDSFDCQDTMSFRQYVVDATSPYSGRVTMCIQSARRWTTANVQLSLVPYYLSKGFQMGACGAVPSKQGEFAFDEIEDIYKVYPNPFANVLNIEFLNLFEEEVNIELTDMTGRVVKELFKGQLFEGDFVSLTMDASDLPNGMYLLRYNSNSDMRVDKVQLMR